MSDQGRTKQQQELAELRHRIAELEAADHNRQRLEKDLDLTFRLSPMSMCIAGFDGYLKRVNPVYQKICGYTQEELLTRPYVEFMHPDDRVALKALVNQLANGVPVFNVETRMCRPDNSVRLVLWTGVPMTEAGTVLCIGRDITATKEAEEALRDSEKKFRSLFQHSAVGTAITRDGVSLLHVNPAFCAFLGYSEDELRGKAIQSLSHPDDWEASSAAIRRTLEKGPRTQRFEKRYLHKSGQVLWGEVNFTLVCDAENRPDYFITQVLDITQRKLAEAKSAAEHILLEGIIESTSYPVFSVDTNYCYTSFNRSHAATMKVIYGADIELGRSILEYPTTPQDRGMVKDNLDRTLRGERLVLEEHVGDEDLLRPCFEISHNPIKGSDGEVVGAAVFAKDITERKRTEEALRESEERFRQAMEATSDGLWDWNVESGEVYYSPAYSQMLGYEAAEFANRTESWTELLHPDDRAKAISVNQDCIENRIPHFEVEFRMRAKSGAWRTILGRGKAVCRDTDGRATRLIGTHVDITDRKRAEAALKQAHDELERRVKERTAELTRANEELAIFRKFAEASGEGFGMSEFDGRIVYVNPMLCRLFGEEKSEDVIGQTVSRYYPEEYMQRRKSEMIPALLREGYWYAEQTVLLRDGMPIQTSQSTFLIRDENGDPFRIAVVVSDITERKRADEALAESEAKYRHLVEATDTGYLILDGEGRVVDANAEYVRLTGHRTLSEIMGRRVEEWTAPNEAERNIQEVQNCLATGTVRQLEVGYLGPDGNVTPIEVNAKVIETKQGKQILSLCRDITERKQAEAALRQSHDELQAIYDGMVDGLHVMSLATLKPVRVNSALCRMMGYSEEEALLLSPNDVHPPEELPRILAEMQAFLEGRGVGSSDVPMMRKDGSIFYADITASQIVYHDVPSVMCFFRDITERKRTEEALRQSEKKYRMLIEASPDAVVMADPQMRMVFASPQAVSLYGADSPEEMCGLPLIDFIVAEDRPRAIDGTALLFQRGLRRNSEYTFLRKDGTRFPCELSSAVVKNDLGQPTAVIAIVRDITDRKLAEEALERERQSLWRMLQASDHERQIISYDIHDGLAQYLAAAGMQFQVFDAIRESNPEAAKKAYDAAVQLVSQSHFEARRLISEVRPPIIDENGIEMAISHLVHEHRRHGGPTIKFDSDVQFQRLPSILENALYRIIQEALTNACKHSKAKRVAVTLAQEGQNVRLEVRDWGIGFDPDSVEKGHFGLEGIRQRVRLLGGRLTIDSTPDSGTLIQVIVPIVERKSEE